MSETKTYYATNMNPPIIKVGEFAFRRYPDGSVMIRDILIRQEDIPSVALALLGPPTPEMIERVVQSLISRGFYQADRVLGQQTWQSIDQDARAVLTAAFGLPE